jgi:hypothetical protein
MCFSGGSGNANNAAAANGSTRGNIAAKNVISSTPARGHGQERVTNQNVITPAGDTLGGSTPANI